jgi:hypothetical protein
LLSGCLTAPDILAHTTRNHFCPLATTQTVVNRLLEIARGEGKIGSPLEARVTFVLPAEDRGGPLHTALLGIDGGNSDARFLVDVMQTSQVELRFEGEAGAEAEGGAEDGGAFCLAENVEVELSGGLPGLHRARVVIRPALGHKCERCWKFATELRSADGYDAACCPDCLSAVRVLASR